MTDELIIVTGLSLIPFEERDLQPKEPIDGQPQGAMDPGTAFNCLMDAIGAVAGIAGLVKDFVTMWNSGAAVTTVIRFARNMIGKACAWFAVGWAVVEFGECVGWWHQVALDNGVKYEYGPVTKDPLPIN